VTLSSGWRDQFRISRFIWTCRFFADWQTKPGLNVACGLSSPAGTVSFWLPSYPLVRMHPKVRRDPAPIGQLDQVHRRRPGPQLVVVLFRRRVGALIAPMPQLTRRSSPDAPEECWHVYYGDVRVGTIAIRTGRPPGEDPWQWSCGFYPGAHPRECTDGRRHVRRGPRRVRGRVTSVPVEPDGSRFSGLAR
jgi:hypothetical protein